MGNAEPAGGHDHDAPQPSIWAPLWLAHHRREQLDRCLLMPAGSRRVALCARCVGLYATLALTLTLQLTVLGQPASVGTLDWWIVLGLSAPALLDWGLGRLGRRGSNLGRLLTGVALGVALGRSLLLHFRDPPGEVLVVQLALLAIGALVFELVGRLGPVR